MTQFYEIARGQPKLATLSRELSWSHTLAIRRECEHYLWTTRQKWTSRELERQIVNGRFERTALSQTKLSAVPRELRPMSPTFFGTVTEGCDKDSEGVRPARAVIPNRGDLLS
jgi:hypothetical protein